MKTREELQVLVEEGRDHFKEQLLKGVTEEIEAFAKNGKTVFRFKKKDLAYLTGISEKYLPNVSLQYTYHFIRPFLEDAGINIQYDTAGYESNASDSHHSVRIYWSKDESK